MVERAWSLPLTDIPREGHGCSLAGSDRQREPRGCEKAEASFPLPACPLRTLPAATQLMKCSWRTMMAAEEASSCQVPRRPWASILRMTISVLISTGTCYLICNLYFSQHQQPDSTRWDLAELQLNHTGSRQDPRLRWQGSPALGRSFLHGPELDDNGQLRIQRDGIYRLHIQVTLANCSSSTWTAEPQRATLTVAICSPAAHSISLLRLSFHRGGCWVASQRLTFLARGDVLCTNLTLPLLPSRNADETFFGIQWVGP
ncbi:CD70 antigen [Muntiacus reevesi]